MNGRPAASRPDAPRTAAAGTGGLAARAARFAAGLRAVLERDFFVLTSGGRFVLFRTIVVLVLAALAIVILANIDPSQRIASAKADEVGRAVFTGFFIAYPILVLLVGPALAAGAIAGERSTDTLTLVLAAPIRPFALVLAKFLSRLGALMVPLVGGLPIAAICFLYGGISASLFRDWFLLVLAFAVMAVSASVLASAYSKSVATAIVGAYFLAVVVPGLESWGAVYAYYGVYNETAPKQLTETAPWLADNFSWLVDHTGARAFFLLGEATFSAGKVKGDIEPFLWTTTFCALVALVLAAARVSREASAMAAGGPRRGRVRTQRFANPVFGRALQTLPFRRGGLASATSLVVVAGLTWLPVMVDWETETVFAGMQICTWTTFFVVLARASQMIATERQQGSLPVLLATRLTPGQIVRGKTFGLAALGTTLLLPGFVLGLTGAMTVDFPPAHTICWFGASAVVLLFFAAVGLRVSAGASTAGKAAGLAFGLSIGGMVLHLLILLAVFISFGTGGDDAGVALLMATPGAVVAQITSAPGGPGAGASGADKQLAWAVFWGVVYLVGALALLGSATAHLEETAE